ncbi:MAG: transcription elongation factor GreA [Chloroflexota bacterium]
MAINKPHLLTKVGLKKLEAELDHLKTTAREEVAERLHQAFDDGQDDDFIDNAELDAARQEQSFIEGRIIELEEILKNYEIIKGGKSEFVRVGTTVTVSEVGYDEEEKYVVVGEFEANPVDGKISNESPLGRALMGKKVGEQVQVNAPNGILDFVIVKIK